jgi:hypothetical protein
MMKAVNAFTSFYRPDASSVTTTRNNTKASAFHHSLSQSHKRFDGEMRILVPATPFGKY